MKEERKKKVLVFHVANKVLQFACNLPTWQSETNITGFKLPYFAKPLGENGLIS